MLIVRLDAIGDALALTPLIAALRERGACVDAVLQPYNAGVFSNCALDHVYVATFPLRDSSIETRRAIAQLGAQLAKERYDYALIATEDPGGYRLASASRARRRIGFENGWGKPAKALWARLLCTHTVYRSAGLGPNGPHECEVLFSLGRELLGDTLVPRDPDMLRPLVIDDEPPPDDRILVQITDKWQRLGASLDDLASLARDLTRRHELRFVAAQSETEFAQRFAAATGAQIEYFGQLAPWKEAIASARVVVAPDSGAVQVAGMVGTPVAAVFPQANFALQSARWAPWAAPYRAVKMEAAWPVIAADAAGDLLRCTDATYTG